MEAGMLFIVGTPIGNLGDITLRALETLKSVSFVLAEDTRVTKKLFAKYEIYKPIFAAHEHTEEQKLMSFLQRIEDGESAAAVTDAGTPGLSDPGNKLVALALKQGISVVPIPGVSALGTLVSVAGIDMHEFLFLGFPPHKKGRETFFKKVAVSECPVMYYESPHRLVKNLKLLVSFSPEHQVVIGRELTKFHEEVFRGPLTEAILHFDTKEVKGELTVIGYLS